MAAAAASIDELDVLINNAGILIPTAADPAEERANLEAMMDLHLHSPLKLIDALLPALQREQPTHDREHDLDGGLCQRARLRGLLHQ